MRRQAEIREEQRRALGLEADEVYRLWYEACFLSRAFVRVSRRRDEIELIAGIGLMDPKVQVARLLTGKEWRSFVERIDAVGFWAFPERHERWGLDGETWCIDGRRGDRYHRSECWSPTRGAFFDLGMRLVALAGIVLPVDYP
jgi:hypothetical protein